MNPIDIILIAVIAIIVCLAVIGAVKQRKKGCGCGCCSGLCGKCKSNKKHR